MKINKEITKKVMDPTVIWSLICAISIIALLTVFIQARQSQESAQKSLNQKNTSGQSLKEAIVSLDFGNGKVRKFKGPVENNAKAWDLFQQAIAVGSINVEMSDHFVPNIIDGVKDGTNGKHWYLYVNNVKQKFAPFEINVKPGDEVVFRFE